MDEKEKETKLKKLFLHPVSKAILVGILTVAIAVISGFPQSGIKWIILIFVASLYIAVVAAYAVFETNYYLECRSLEQENQAYEDALRRVNTICRTSATTINDKIHEIQNTGQYNPNTWNFKIACDLVCEQLFESLCILLAKGNKKPNIGVGYVRLDESDPKGDTIILCSYHQSRNEDKPRIINQKRSISNPNEYHDAELFQLHDDKAELLLTPDEVRDKLVYRRGTSRKKYKQYIGVPVICDKKECQKMVGLLEITCLSESYFPQDNDRSNGYVDDFLAPYAYIILLLHKMEKALLAVPTIPQAEEATINGKS